MSLCICAPLIAYFQDHSTDAKIGNIVYSLLDAWSTLGNDDQQAKLKAIHERFKGGAASSSNLDAPQSVKAEDEGGSHPQETAEVEASDDQEQD